jgi:hypothetical protein
VNREEGRPKDNLNILREVRKDYGRESYLLNWQDLPAQDYDGFGSCPLP